MLCKICGKENAEDTAFCMHCGAYIADSSNDEPKATDSANQEQSDYNSESNQGYSSEPTPPVKKSSGGISKIIDFIKTPKGWISAIAIVLALIIVFNFSGIAGFFVKLFGSDATYMTYVEGKNVETAIDAATNVYGTYLDILDLDYGVEAEVEITVGEDAKDLLKTLSQLTGEDIDVDMEWLKEISMGMAANLDEDAANVIINLDVNGETILDAEAIASLADGYVCAGITNLSKKYLSMEIGEDQIEQIQKALDLVPQIVKVLPKESKLNKILNKYAEIALDQIEDNVKSKKKDFKVKKVEDTLTALTYSAEYEDLGKIAIAVLEELKEDGDIKDIIENINSLEIEEMPEIDYDAFVESIDSYLENVENIEWPDGDAFEYVCYVNSSHEVMGRSIYVEEEQVFHYLMTHDGRDFGFELNIDNDILIEGTGKDKGGELTGEFDVYKTYNDNKQKIISFNVEDFDTSKLEDCELDGKFIIEIVGMDLVIEADAGIESGKLSVSLMDDDEVMLGIKVTYDSGSAGKISVPSDKNLIDAEDTEGLLEWVETIDFDKLIKAMNKADVDEEIVEMVEELIEQYVE